MSENTKIEWADHTFNPWIGCTPISSGCDHCYAADWAKRYGRDFGTLTRTKTWDAPLKWQRQHTEFFAQHGRRQRVFCASLADVFDNQVPADWRVDLLQLIAHTPDLDWLLLTKRIGNAHAMLDAALAELSHGLTTWADVPWPNVWIGATVVNQAEADRDIPKLLKVPARVRFLSLEPMLGPVDLQKACTKRCPNGDCFDHMTGHRVTVDSENGGTLIECTCSRLNGLHWVIVGGESGPSARPMHPDWARNISYQCIAAGVPFLFKQWGEYGPCEIAPPGSAPLSVVTIEGRLLEHPLDGPWGTQDEIMSRFGKKAAGRLLDGIEHDGFPEAAS